MKPILPRLLELGTDFTLFVAGIVWLKVAEDKVEVMVSFAFLIFAGFLVAHRIIVLIDEGKP